jgi:hypothetical protein
MNKFSMLARVLRNNQQLGGQAFAPTLFEAVFDDSFHVGIEAYPPND